MKLLFLLQGTTQNHNTDIIVVNNDNNNKHRGISNAAATTKTKTALTEPIKRSANYDGGVCFVRVLLCLKSLSANSPLYICTKCFIYYKLVFCVAFFFLVSFVDLHTCCFIHSLQTIMQEVFILYLIYHCYFCDCFFFFILNYV